MLSSPIHFKTPVRMAVLTAHGTLLVAVLLGAVIARTAWELLFSPLKAFPGPFLAKFTNVLRAFRAYEGNFDIHARAWHRKCGSAVRVGPNAISLSDPDMIKVVYAVRNPWLKVAPVPCCTGWLAC